MYAPAGGTVTGRTCSAPGRSATPAHAGRSGTVTGCTGAGRMTGRPAAEPHGVAAGLFTTGRSIATDGAAAGLPCAAAGPAWAHGGGAGRSGTATGRAAAAPHGAATGRSGMVTVAGLSGTTASPAAGPVTTGRSCAPAHPHAAASSSLAPQGPSAGLTGIDFPPTPHGPPAAGSPIGLRTTTDSAVTGPCSVTIRGYGIFPVASGAACAASASGETSAGGKALIRRSGRGELCQETWIGWVSALPARVRGSTVAVMMPRLVLPCGSRPILQTSGPVLRHRHFGGAARPLRFLSGVAVRATSRAGTVP